MERLSPSRCTIQHQENGVIQTSPCSMSIQKLTRGGLLFQDQPVRQPPLLCLPSVAWIHLGPFSIQLLLNEGFPWLCFQPLIPSLHLGLSSSSPPSAPPGTYRPYDSTEIPQFFGSTLVRRRLACVMDLRTVHCAPSLHPYRSVCFRLPSGSTSVALTPPQPSGSPVPPRMVIAAAPLWPPGPAVLAGPICNLSVPRAPPTSASLLIPMMWVRASPTWLLPPSMSPWASFLAGLWVSTSPLLLLAVLPSPDWLCPSPTPRLPPEPPSFLVGLCLWRGNAA